MQLKSILAAAALSAAASANFVIVTTPSANIDIFGNWQSQFAERTAAAASRFADLTKSLAASDLSRGASAQQALNSFLATASLTGVPSKVTEVGAIETLNSTPAWFSQLPSDVKSYYESQNAKVQSVVNEVVGGKASSGVSAASGPSSTGAASHDKIVHYLGAGAAAAMAGVFAL